jgi:acetate kinase
MCRENDAAKLPDAKDDQIGSFPLGNFEDLLHRDALAHHGFGFAPEFGFASDEGAQTIDCDMRRLHQATGNAQARLAIDSFPRSVKKAIAGFIAILEGLDLLVFTGGIGEHDAVVREKICGGLQTFGVALDASSNASNLSTISAPNSLVRVCIIPTEEEAQIARHTYRMLQDGVSSD